MLLEDIEHVKEVSVLFEADMAANYNLLLRVCYWRRRSVKSQIIKGETILLTEGTLLTMEDTRLKLTVLTVSFKVASVHHKGIYLLFTL